MKLLLDSHTVIWAMTAPQNLSAKAKRELSNINNELIVSTASLFELTIKINIGKLTYKGGMAELLRDIDTANILHCLSKEIIFSNTKNCRCITATLSTGSSLLKLKPIN